MVRLLRADVGALEGFVLMALCALTSLAVVVAFLASLFIGREQARTAADMAALAAAQTQDCTIAAESARRNGAALRSCRLDGVDAYVSVEMPTRLGGFLISAGAPRQYRAMAHAST
jgi:secretion/DNA translocation related TadE-like protein